MEMVTQATADRCIGPVQIEQCHFTRQFPLHAEYLIFLLTPPDSYRSEQACSPSCLHVTLQTAWGNTMSEVHRLVSVPRGGLQGLIKRQTSVHKSIPIVA